jgi:hypothetical protein
MSPGGLISFGTGDWGGIVLELGDPAEGPVALALGLAVRVAVVFVADAPPPPHALISAAAAATPTMMHAARRDLMSPRIWQLLPLVRRAQGVANAG